MPRSTSGTWSTSGTRDVEAGSPGPTSRGPYTTGRATRERILEVAAQAFGRDGYHGTSLAAIGRELGITQQGVLHHFRTKPALLRAVLERRDEEDRATWPPREEMAGLAVLDAWDRTVERNAGTLELVRLAHMMGAEAAGGDHPAREHCLTRIRGGMDTLVTALRAGVESGELRADLDCEITARQVIAMSEGLENQWLLDPAALDLVGCFHAFTAALRRQITRDPAV